MALMWLINSSGENIQNLAQAMVRAKPALKVMASARTGAIRFSHLPEGLNWQAWTTWSTRAIENRNTLFVDVFYAMLTQPVQLLKLIGSGPWELTPPMIRKAFLIAATVSVVLVSFLVSVVKGLWAPPQSIESVLFGTFAGALSWGLAAGFASLLGFVFSGRLRLFNVLCTTGFAVLPWVLLVPSQLLQLTVGETLPTVNILLTLFNTFLALWTTWLFMLALKYSFGLSGVKTALLALLPLLCAILYIASFLGLYWLSSRLYLFS